MLADEVRQKVIQLYTDLKIVMRAFKNWKTQVHLHTLSKFVLRHVFKNWNILAKKHAQEQASIVLALHLAQAYAQPTQVQLTQAQLTQVQEEEGLNLALQVQKEEDLNLALQVQEEENIKLARFLSQAQPTQARAQQLARQAQEHKDSELAQQLARQFEQVQAQEQTDSELAEALSMIPDLE
jgi:hypothetical protein